MKRPTKDQYPPVTDTLTRHLNIMAEVLKIIAAEHEGGTLSPEADLMLATDVGFDVWYDDEDRSITVWRSTSAAGITTLRGRLNDLDPKGEHEMVLAV